MKDFDKLFDDLFAEDFSEIEAELDKLDSAQEGGGGDEVVAPVEEAGGADETVDPVVADAVEGPAPQAESNALTTEEIEATYGSDVAGDVPSTGSFYDEDEDEDDEVIEDTEVGGSFEASCPYCGESVSIFLDPAGGSVQDYVEDCFVCCQPMTVQVRFSGEGQADVMIDTTG